MPELIKNCAKSWVWQSHSCKSIAWVTAWLELLIQKLCKEVCRVLGLGQLYHFSAECPWPLAGWHNGSTRECMVTAAQLADGHWCISADVRCGSTCIGTVRWAGQCWLGLSPFVFLWHLVFWGPGFNWSHWYSTDSKPLEAFSLFDMHWKMAFNCTLRGLRDMIKEETDLVNSLNQ